MGQVTEKDLCAALDDIRERYRALKDDELFVAWFMKCFVTDTEEAAVASLVGGSRDKNLDAIHVDDRARKVFVVQGKYRQSGKVGPEKRNDVLAFAELANSFSDDDAFRDLVRGLAVEATGRAEQAHKCIRERGYRLQLYFVTTGRCSTAVEKDASSALRRAGHGAVLTILDHKRVLQMLSDYLDGVAPPVPELEIEIEGGRGVQVGGVLQRVDRETDIESWVLPVSGDQGAQMYESAGIRLFARNVRGFLGETQINVNMQKTLESEPEYFWYYNNGITIVCDKAEKTTRRGSEFMRLVNPQVINGQQTTRTLYQRAKKGTSATVLVRIISVPRESEKDSRRFESLISKIVAATNWQNTIRPSDLMSNDRRQVELERHLRHLGYQYLRKRQSKAEARRSVGVKHNFVVTKEELAQVVAATVLDPLVVRSGKEQLFEERYYNYVFPDSDPTSYLPRYWLGKHVSLEARGHPERAYAKWLAIHFLWKHLAPTLRSKGMKESFRIECERGLFKTLCQASDQVFRSISAYYRANRGSGAAELDPSVFFKRAHRHTEFAEFWKSPANRQRARFDRAWSAFALDLQGLSEQ